MKLIQRQFVYFLQCHRWGIISPPFYDLHIPFEHSAMRRGVEFNHLRSNWCPPGVLDGFTEEPVLLCILFITLSPEL